MQYGVNHIDVAASYGDAELRIAPWLKRYPDYFFVATKTDKRTAQSAKEELHRSLDRMGVEHIDLWQLHNLADPIDWDAHVRWRSAISGLRSTQGRHHEAIGLAIESVSLLDGTDFLVSQTRAKMTLARALRAAGDEPAASTAATEIQVLATAKGDRAMLRTITTFLEG